MMSGRSPEHRFERFGPLPRAALPNEEDDACDENPEQEAEERCIAEDAVGGKGPTVVEDGACTERLQERNERRQRPEPARERTRSENSRGGRREKDD
jgi:hypothetical protein